MGTLTECVVPAGDVSGYVAKAVRLGTDVRWHEGVVKRLEGRREAFFDDMVIGNEDDRYSNINSMWCNGNMVIYG
jgi:hypothetical protein